MTNPEINNVLWPDTPFSLRKHMILCGRRGSEAHGTYIPPEDPSAIDDRDLLGIVVPPIEYYFGTRQWENTEAIKGEWDVVLYSLAKFGSLLCKQNPNVLCMLWLEPEDYLLTTTAGQLLIDNRHLFRCKREAAKSFLGYAHGQIKKMTSFGEFRGYMGAKRKALVEKFGFDTKNAAHALRILRMGEEYLRTGEIMVKRTRDREYLIDVKQGRVPLEAVQAEADKTFEKLHEAADNSVLPNEINYEEVDELLVTCTKIALSHAGSL